MLRDYFLAILNSYQFYKSGAWCYEDGCIYRGLVLLDRAEPEGPWFDYLKRLVDQQVDEKANLADYRIDEFNIDHILSGRALLFLHGRTGDRRYLKAAHLLAEQLARHPRTRTGNYWHKLRYPHQVWLDGLYMALPFQIELGQALGRAELVGDAVNQLRTALNLLFDAETGLYRHGYDEARGQQWADPATGLSPALWSRAIGWMAMAIVDVIDLIGSEAAKASGLADATEHLARTLATHQRDDGRWYQVTDMPDLQGNYAETSATAMFAYFYMVAGRLGLGDDESGRGALDGLSKYAFTFGTDGRLSLGDMCHVAGLGGYENNFRDGTPAYYVSETIVSDDAKGVGPLMMAVAERKMADHQSQRAVLFA